MQLKSISGPGYVSLLSDIFPASYKANYRYLAFSNTQEAEIINNLKKFCETLSKEELLIFCSRYDIEYLLNDGESSDFSLDEEMVKQIIEKVKNSDFARSFIAIVNTKKQAGLIGRSPEAVTAFNFN